MAIELADIRMAAERILPIAHRTPVLTSRTFNSLTGVEALFKCENFQRGGSFKIRGATNFVYSIPLEARSRGVVAFSSGNHGQAVAIAAFTVGIPATVIMPEDAPRAKLAATRGYGATVVTYNRFQEDREAIGRSFSERSGAHLIPPFDHEWIVAGQGTTALELLEEAGQLDALVVCVGGGGLISGSSIVARALHPEIRIFGVEPADGNDFWLSRRKGERVSIPPPTTIADGLRTPMPGAVTWPIVQKHVEDIVLVTDDEIRTTIKFLMERMKIVVEPSGAVAAAAVLHHKLPNDLGRTGIILSGGNLDV